MGESKVYLGDGCYAAFDGYGLELTTENGLEVTSRIYMEPEVYAKLIAYVDRLKAAAHPQSKEPPR